MLGDNHTGHNKNKTNILAMINFVLDKWSKNLCVNLVLIVSTKSDKFFPSGVECLAYSGRACLRSSDFMNVQLLGLPSLLDWDLVDLLLSCQVAGASV